LLTTRQTTTTTTTTTNDSRPILITKWGDDLNLDDIEHWCLDPNITTCQCANPLMPMHRHGHKTWTRAYLDNVHFAHMFQQFLVKAKTSKANKFSSGIVLDVVFLGDSITEGWRGTSFGQPIPEKQENVDIFHAYFNSSRSNSSNSSSSSSSSVRIGGGQLDGLALGIAGDKSPNLLWRLQNGELPEMLTAKVFWVLIGTNDFLKPVAVAVAEEGGQNVVAVDQCSEEVVFMGIRRVVEEIMIRKPKSMIVVNGLLPRSDIGGRLYKEGEKTVMDAIDIVNHRLKDYCNGQSNNLEYFQASDIFIDTNASLGEEKYGKYIPTDRMNDFIHPTPLGYKLWAEKIREKVKSLTDETLAVL